MRIAAIQMAPGDDRAANITQAAALMERAARDGAELVALPEMWTCLGGDRARKWSQAEALPPAGKPPAAGSAYAALQDFARRHGLLVHGGSLGERDGDKLFNTTVVFDPDGRELARYRKIHLFDISTPDGVRYGESQTYGAGTEVATFRWRGTGFGLAVCYDMRFAELFLALRRGGAEVIFVPAAFTVPTGRAHWDVLLRARAIETQCTVVAPATCGTHRAADGSPRETFGNSLIVDGWGTVLARLGDAPGVALAAHDPEALARWRRDMPVLDHRRLV